MEGVLEVDEEMRDDGMRDVAKRWWWEDDDDLLEAWCLVHGTDPELTTHSRVEEGVKI
jgi:hypothetical protein